MNNLDLAIHINSILRHLWLLQQSNLDTPELRASYQILEILNQRLLNQETNT